MITQADSFICISLTQTLSENKVTTSNKGRSEETSKEREVVGVRGCPGQQECWAEPIPGLRQAPSTQLLLGATGLQGEALPSLEEQTLQNRVQMPQRLGSSRPR